MPILRKRVKTDSKIKQQQKQQTFITSKLFVRFKKQKLITKSTYRQMNLKLNKITYKSPEKIWTSSKKRTKTVKLKNSLIFLKTIKFKVIKTIRYQVKYHEGLQLLMLL